MPDEVVAPGQVPENLVGRGFVRRTPALSTVWRRLQEEVPEYLHSEVEESCFVLLKPDILASRKEELLWDRLLEVGAQPLVAWVCLHSSVREFEELYKFNLTLSNDQCMLSSWWLHSLPYQMGPVICLLIRVPRKIRGNATACDFIAALKGPSNPFLASSGQWRHDFGSTNMALNLVHSSDDAISSIREFRIFGSAELLRRALERSILLNGDEASLQVITKAVYAEFRVAVDLAGYPNCDLDPVSNLVRLKLRLTQTIGTSDFSSGDLSKEYTNLLRTGGTALERWHRYRSLCDTELKQCRNLFNSEILRELATTAGYRPELADLLAAEMRRRRLPYSDWERIVVDTTLYFYRHLPSD